MSQAYETVRLEFTQEDRDRLMRIDQSVLTLVGRHDAQDRRLARHNTRIKRLEALREQGRGAAAAMKLLWVVVGAIAAVFGWHISKH